jgi:hypothetical protein
VISSNGVRTFITAGGTLRYVPVEEDGVQKWALVGVTPAGEELPVILSRTGEPRMFFSANAIVTYHQSLYPDDGGVFIPYHEKPGPADPEASKSAESSEE